MFKNQLNSIIALSLLILAIGCDKACKQNVHDRAAVVNSTGRPVTVNFCKGRFYGETQVTIPASASVQEVDLGTRQETKAQGGLNASCENVSDMKLDMGISLSPNSYGQVKLCYDDSTGENLIIEAYQMCPADTLEQTSTAPCVQY